MRSTTYVDFSTSSNRTPHHYMQDERESQIEYICLTGYKPPRSDRYQFARMTRSPLCGEPTRVVRERSHPFTALSMSSTSSESAVRSPTASPSQLASIHPRSSSPSSSSIRTVRASSREWARDALPEPSPPKPVDLGQGSGLFGCY